MRTRRRFPAEFKAKVALEAIQGHRNGCGACDQARIASDPDCGVGAGWITCSSEAAKDFRRLKAHKQLPILKAALAAHHAKHATKQKLEDKLKAA